MTGFESLANSILLTERPPHAEQPIPLLWTSRSGCSRFFRLGGTRTELSDGRVIWIGGEHEDGYDPDFCIYNGKYFYKFLSATEQERPAKLQYLHSR